MALIRLVYDQGEVSARLQQLVNNISGLYQEYYTKYLQNGQLGAVSIGIDYTKLESAWNEFYAYEPQNYAESDYKNQMNSSLEEMKQQFEDAVGGALVDAGVQIIDETLWGIAGDILGSW